MNPQVRDDRPTPLRAVCALTFLASIGTGVIWNGVPFIAKHDYGYSSTQTLTLYVILGAVYVVGALSAGKLLRLIGRHVSARTLLMMILIVESILCLSPLLSRDDSILWIVACGNSVLSSWLWPIVESYVTAGRHGERMRSAIGWWNLSWTSAVAISLILMAPLVEHNARMSIVLLGAANALALVALLWFERMPGAHDQAQSHASVRPEYPFLLQAARMLLPLSYVLNSAISPLLPYLFDRLALEASWETPTAATWMTVRIVSMAAMWRLGFWHGRWGTLLAGGTAMIAGFALIVTAYSLAMMVIGLAVFGAGMGIVYYAALYYAMSVGRAEVDAGGKFEALIGAGYTIGPITGVAGQAISGAANRAGWNLWDGAGIVALVGILMAVGAAGVMRTYAQARSRRR